MGDPDTSIGAGRTAFAQTQWGTILSIRSAPSDESRKAMQDLAAAYWRPVYKYIRIAWRKSNDEAKDLTQEFFAAVFQPEFLARADPSRGSFRSFVLASLRNFLRDRERHAAAVKRGGAALDVSMDRDVDVAADADPEREFMRAWAEEVLARALEELERTLASRGRAMVFDVFRAYCLEAEPGAEPSYRSLAESRGIPVSDVTNFLFEARRELRRILERRIAVTLNGGSVEGELRELFGA